MLIYGALMVIMMIPVLMDCCGIDLARCSENTWLTVVSKGKENSTG